MAVMMAVDKWRQYLQRGPFLILTDHKSLCSFSDQHLTTDLQRKAMAKLAGLQIQFKYKKGVRNTAADSPFVQAIFWIFQPVNLIGFRKSLINIQLIRTRLHCFSSLPYILLTAFKPRTNERSGDSAATQVRMKWQNLDPDHYQATWEDYYLLKQRFLGAVI